SLLMNYRCVYALHEISGNVPMNNVKLDMYLRQPNAAYQLQVGVWDDATSTFEPVALFNNTTTGVEHVTCDFSGYNGNGRRVAFRNVLKSGVSYAYSYNYLDDITLTEMEDCSITLPYTETFENFTTSTTATTGEEPTCWELVRTDAPTMPNDKRPQLYYRSDFAHSGSYSLLMNYRCVYALPEISGNVPMNNVKLDMYLRQPNTSYQLQVGVWDDATSTFEPVALFKNSTNNVTHVECDFSNYSGNGRRVAFRNVLKSGFSYAYSYNYLDDITLTRISNNKSTEVTDANAVDALAADRDQVDVVVYPNPTKDVVNVQYTMNNAQCSGIEIVDVYGKVVRTDVETLRATSLPTQINVSGLAAGMYFVRVTTDRGVVTKPFVKR
ncbi:MAG: T9SS type A sorting domain-containing protein, partial [Bacteroidales bacterium]|nr:T9SS type A sorting domain-containing protein [Bacteroidales bacterium]